MPNTVWRVRRKYPWWPWSRWRVAETSMLMLPSEVRTSADAPAPAGMDWGQPRTLEIGYLREGEYFPAPVRTRIVYASSPIPHNPDAESLCYGLCFDFPRPISEEQRVWLRLTYRVQRGA